VNRNRNQSLARSALKALSAALVLCAFGMAGPAAMAITYSSGDVIYVAYGSGGGPEYIVDIGPSSTYLTATTTFNVTQVKAADFSSIIGFSRPNVFVGVFGLKTPGAGDRLLSNNGPSSDGALIGSNILGAVSQTEGWAHNLSLYGSAIIGSPEAVSFPSNGNGSYESSLNFVSRGAIAGNLAYNVETAYTDALGNHIASPVKIRFYRGERNPFTGLADRGCVGYFSLQTNGTVTFSPDVDCDLLADDIDLCVGVNSTNNTDTDGDLHAAPCDCNDGNNTVWSFPGEINTTSFPSKTTVAWSAPPDPGGTQAPLYDVFRGTLASPSTPTYACFSADQAGTTKADATNPGQGSTYLYLMRAQNSCGNGTVGTGVAANGTFIPRVVPNCP
jgi:hypothetical protein